ncbi:hypothetical protein [Paraburkholderia sacchari]|uniref:hypothetical protein n=1 Tax=Paraburkholderia sacchari TaxID=159450 RepID=UPI001BD0D4AE|nr:hypothetical protein [Paraburkholderia sacchari]
MDDTGPNAAEREDLAPFSDIDRLKRVAKALRKHLDPDKLIGLSRVQGAVVKCIGRDQNEVFSGLVPPHPIFPSKLAPRDRLNYQRSREVTVLREYFPHVDVGVIEDFLANWKLVVWRSVDARGDEEGRSSKPAATTKDTPRRKIGLNPGPVVSSDAHLELTIHETKNLAPLILPVSIERFMPPTLSYAEERAAALSAITGTVSNGLALEFTARIFGFSDWSALSRGFVLAARSRFDEELPPTEVARRHRWQTAALGVMLTVEKVDAAVLLHYWRPTGQSPTYATLPSWQPSSSSKVPAATISITPPPRRPGRISLKKGANPRSLRGNPSGRND